VQFPEDYDSLRKDERAEFRQSRYCKTNCCVSLPLAALYLRPLCLQGSKPVQAKTGLVHHPPPALLPPGAAVAEVLNDVQQVLGGDRALQLLAEPLFRVSAAPARVGLLWRRGTRTETRNGKLITSIGTPKTLNGKPGCRRAGSGQPGTLCCTLTASA